MYDNIDTAIRKEDCPGVDFLKDTPNLLDEVTSQKMTQRGEYINGYLGKLNVSISENRVSIYNSSLCKYYLGDNFQTLSCSDTKKAIEQISDSLHLPFHLANVTRIDVAQNIIVRHDEKAYYPFLGVAPYYERLEQNNGLYYSNSKRQKLFYGKEHEQKVKRQPIPELYQNRNTLRYELRFRNRLREQLNRPEITAGLLYDEKFYRELVKRWKDEYFNIQKINSNIVNMEPTGSTKEFGEQIALISILQMGQSQFMKTVDVWQKTGAIDKVQAKRHRSFVKRLSKVKKNGEGNGLIAELDNKIKQAARV